MYSKSKFGKEWKELIENGFDVVEVSRWAHDKVYLKHCREIDSDLERIIMQIIAMDEGRNLSSLKLNCRT